MLTRAFVNFAAALAVRLLRASHFMRARSIASRAS